MKVNQLKRRLKFLAIIFIITSCSKSKMHNEEIIVSKVDINESYESVKEEQVNQSAIDNNVTFKTPKNLKIIKSANAKYKVKNVKKVTNQIKKVAAKYHAYISDLRFENNLYKKENRFTIKIPEQFFDVMMDSIGSFSEFIDYENITTKDVTEEFVDLTSRLKTKEEVKERYELVLRGKAKTVKDILITEDKLRIIQEEIDAAKGKLTYITNKVSYSTIQIDLYETVAYKEEPLSYKKTFQSKLKNGLSFGWEFIKSILIVIVYVWPLFVIGIIVFFFLKKKK